MEVSYGKLSVNDRKEMGEWRLPLPRNDGDLVTVASPQRHDVTR